MSDAIEISRFVKSVWWLVLLRGVFAIILGVLAFIWPVATAGAVFWVFGIYLIMDGITAIVQALSTRKEERGRVWLVVLGALGVLAGVLMLIFPLAAGALALLVLLWMIAVWAIIAGVATIPAASSLASGGARTLSMVLAVLSIVFGVVLMIMLFVTPTTALLGLIYILGAYAVLSGIVLVVIAFQARAAADEVLRSA